MFWEAEVQCCAWEEFPLQTVCCLWEREGAFPIVLSVSLVSLPEALGMGLVSPVIF